MREPKEGAQGTPQEAELGVPKDSSLRLGQWWLLRARKGQF